MVADRWARARIVHSRPWGWLPPVANAAHVGARHVRPPSSPASPRRNHGAHPATPNPRRPFHPRHHALALARDTARRDPRSPIDTLLGVASDIEVGVIDSPAGVIEGLSRITAIRVAARCGGLPVLQAPSTCGHSRRRTSRRSRSHGSRLLAAGSDVDGQDHSRAARPITPASRAGSEGTAKITPGHASDDSRGSSPRPRSLPDRARVTPGDGTDDSRGSSSRPRSLPDRA